MRFFTRHMLIPAAALCVLACLPFGVSAQSDPQLTQYFEVPSFYNPAAIGRTDQVRLRLGSRLQWVGIDNAPRTFLLTADMPFKLFNKRFAVGLNAYQESAGLYRTLDINAQIGYKFKLWKGELTAALQIGYLSESFKGSEIFIPDDDDYHDGNDEALPRTDVAGSSIDLGVGAFYTHKYFWAGVSMSHLMSPTITFSDDSETGGTPSGGEGETAKNYEFNVNRTLYFMAGGNIPIKNTLFEVLPSVFVKSDFTFTTAEITGRVRYKKFLSAGVGYRYNDAVVAMLGAEFKGFFIGYSFDYPLSAISKASHGSHEILAGYSFKLNLSGKNKNKHKSIRIM